MTGFIIDMFYFLIGIEGKNIYGEDGLLLVVRIPKTVELLNILSSRLNYCPTQYNYDYYDVFQRNTRITLRLLISSFSATR